MTTAALLALVLATQTILGLVVGYLAGRRHARSLGYIPPMPQTVYASLVTQIIPTAGGDRKTAQSAWLYGDEDEAVARSKAIARVFKTAQARGHEGYLLVSTQAIPFPSDPITPEAEADGLAAIPNITQE